MSKDISVQCTRDGMSASLLIPENMKGSSVSEIKQFLNNRGVLYGIDEIVIDKMLQGSVFGKHIVVAKGDRPTPGKPGRIKLLVDLSKVGRPEELERGRVDLKNLGLIVNVQRGTPLARRIPPEPGIDGLTVFGTLVSVVPQKDVSLNSGPGTAVSEEDPDLLISSVDGYLSIRNGRIEVSRRKEIKGDIDYTTGNVIMTGDLRVSGTLRAGFKIVTTGSVLVEGEAEGGVIRCGGSIEIWGGAIGSGAGVLECDGDLRVKHISNFSVIVGGDCLVQEDILHSTVSAQGMVKAGTIVGGSVQAASGIDAKNLGSFAEVRTVLDIENRIRWLKELEESRSQLQEIVADLSQKKIELFRFVRDFMDEQGVIGETDLPCYEKLKAEAVKVNNRWLRVTKRIEALEDFVSKSKNPIIRAATVYPQVVIRRGGRERVVGEVSRNATFRLSE